MTDAHHAILGYDHYHQMLSDSVRMDAYRDAIFQSVKPGDVVVDLGAGTGILGLWALQAGASKVYAIEKTEAIDLARQIAAANHLQDKIEFIQQTSTDVELPEKADLLISETLGSFGIDENTLPFTFDARDRFLTTPPKNTPTRMIPQSLDLFVAPIQSQTIYDKLDFWRHIPDLDFTPAFDTFASKIMIETVAPTDLLTQPIELASIDLRTQTDATFEKNVFIAIKNAGTIHALSGWFTTQLTDDISISTSPADPQTHWKQAVFPFREPIAVIAGDILQCAIELTPSPSNPDDTRLAYQYRCTQIANEPEPAPDAKRKLHNAPCPCGSGRKFSECCLR